MTDPIDIELARIKRERKKREDKAKREDNKANGSTGKTAKDAGLEDRVALGFAAGHAGDFRYVAMWNRWLQWSGAVWRFEDTLCAFDEARKLCRAAGDAKAKTVAAVVTLARSDRVMAATTDQWDSDQWLLNTPDGVINLRTGMMRLHSPDDYITKMTAVAPCGVCPMWLAFLDKVTAGDKDLQAYLQRVIGYSLTGITREHALFFLYGTGANGKSVFLSTVSGILADYQRTAPIETFTASNSDRHPTDLAGLRGARLVTAIETEEGRRWAESKIKALTGGDIIAARFMRQDFFEYVPQFKLVIAGNHKPGLRSVDEAMRRRFNLVPFTVTIPRDERDPDLSEKLKAEWPGILQWMVEGCLAWQRQGLNPPQAVTDATTAYLESQDAVAAWIDDQCERDPTAWTRTQALFASWKAWAERMGEPPRDAKVFRDRLEARGIEHKLESTTKRAGFQGLKLKLPDEEPSFYDTHYRRT